MVWGFSVLWVGGVYTNTHRSLLLQIDCRHILNLLLNHIVATHTAVVVQQAGEFRSLVEEIIQITLKAGPAGIPRAMKAAEAVATTGTEWLQGDRPAIPALLRKLFERLGATYVKLGQFVASSPTLFPEEYVTEFQKCLDATTPIPFSTVREILAKEFGQPLDSIFSSIEEQPIASASIAQVCPPSRRILTPRAR